MIDQEIPFQTRPARLHERVSNQRRKDKDHAPVPKLCGRFDANGQLTYVSREWLERIGSDEGAWRGSGWREFLHPDDCELILAKLKAPGPQTSWQERARFRNAQGAYQQIQVSGALQIDEIGEFKGWLATFADAADDTAAADAVIEPNRCSQLKLERALMNAPSAICVIRGDDLSVELTNEAFRNLIHASSDLTGLKVGDVLSSFGPDVLETIQALSRKGLAGEWTELPIVMDWDHSGETKRKFLNVSCDPLFGDNGKQNGFIVFADDVTEQVNARSKLEEVARRFQALAEAVPSMVFMAHPDGTIDYMNRRWYEYTGLSVDFTSRASGTKVIHGDDESELQAKWGESLRTGRNFEMEYRVRRAFDGEYRWHIARAIPIRGAGGTIQKWFGTITDIHDRKNLEKELRLAKEEADHANQAKSNFLANMSHEIRTPLGAILGFSELLCDSETTLEERSEFLATINRNGRALTQIIDDILDLSKVEAGRLRIEPAEVEVASLIDEVTSLFSISARAKGVELCSRIERGTPQFLYTDGVRLRQILVNIFGNAVKFTEEGRVRISVQPAQGFAGPISVRFRVEDSGLGISSDQQGGLFSPFSQADNSTTRKHGGTGLGLALSRRLARSLGGDVVLEKSGPGEGSTFVITVLANLDPDGRGAGQSTGAQTASTPNPAPTRPLTGAKILLVEDSQDNRMLLERILQRYEVDLDFAVNGHEAVGKALARPYDVILMDIQMPVLNGYEATAMLRQAGYDRPIIALTAHAMLDERRKCLAVGCTDHLTKPLEKQRLLETIQRVLPQAMQNRSARFQ